jgi:transmembrane sensor
VPAAKAAASSWRALARDGDYDRAYEALQREGAGARADQAADLLLEADVARLSRHPAQAVAPLRKLLSSHPGDPRAPLAAFTLGRVLLDDLGRPREAADAFARARAASPGGAMAEDALAREVEAWSRAGEATMARARAEEYVRRHPKGRREKLVRRLGGLEE